MGPWLQASACYLPVICCADCIQHDVVAAATCSWNFTPSPGWSKEESLVLKLLLLRFGIGAWGAIQATGLLPGKLVQQLSSATQRLLGQQSTAGAHCVPQGNHAMTWYNYKVIARVVKCARLPL